MKAAFAWIDGCWGPNDQLKIPLSDRGLQLADGLFETILIVAGEPQLLAPHLARWSTSAALLGMEPPPEQGWLTPLIAEAIARADLEDRPAALRLNWSRDGAGGRGLSGSGAQRSRFWLTLQAVQLDHQPIKAITSRGERRNAHSLLSRCKTFSYGQAIQARQEAERSGVDDALLRNTEGDLCCGTVANLLVQRAGRWLTPPLSSGCLPGVIRQRGLELGRIEEAALGEALQTGDQAVLVNSLSCRPIQSLDGQPMPLSDDGPALWRTLSRNWARN